ncbi:hypothetical protein D3C87_884450 [compost metagenome]
MKRVEEMETAEAMREMLSRAQQIGGRGVQVSRVGYRNMRWEGILTGDVPEGMHAYLYNGPSGELLFETREEPGTVSEDLVKRYEEPLH